MRDDEEQQKGAAVAGLAEDVLQAVWAAGDHEVSRADEGEEAKLSGGRVCQSREKGCFFLLELETKRADSGERGASFFRRMRLEGQDSRAASVRGPASPSTTSPAVAWKAITAALVCGPKTLSGVPGWKPFASSAGQVPPDPTWAASRDGVFVAGTARPGPVMKSYPGTRTPAPSDDSRPCRE